MNNSIEVLNSTRGHDKIIADNNIGCMMLKNMGWKEGDELGKNNQGVKSPIEYVIYLKYVGIIFLTDNMYFITSS